MSGKTWGSLLLVSITSWGLAACTSQPKVSPSSAISSDVSSQSVEPSPSVTAGAIQALQSESMDKTCSGIYPVGTLYEFDPNVTLVTPKAPATATAVEQVKLGGIVCELKNLSSDSSTQIVIVKLSPPSASEMRSRVDKDSAAGSYQVATGIRASFSGKTGQFIKNNYWVSVTSISFQNPVEASQLSYLTALSL